jgi:uncharacterized Zn-finger protein
MNTNEGDVLCKSCGKSLTTFLREMADHNEEVVCPHCGKIYSRADAEDLAKAAAPTNKK